MKDDEEPTAEELREAEALAAALAGERPPSAPPPEALEAAALLRYARHDALDPGRQAAMAAELRRAVGARRPRRRWPWLLAPAFAAVAAAVLVVRANAPTRPEATAMAPPPPLPPLSAALLAAQAEVARGKPEAIAALDAQMRSYRSALYRNLGGRPRGAK